jgi:hypothetical protein
VERPNSAAECEQPFEVRRAAYDRVSKGRVYLCSLARMRPWAPLAWLSAHPRLWPAGTEWEVVSEWIAYPPRSR